MAITPNIATHGLTITLVATARDNKPAEGAPTVSVSVAMPALPPLAQ